ENMMTKSVMIFLIVLSSILFVSAQEPRNAAGPQAPSAGGAAVSGSLRQIIPGHYVYSTNNGGRAFSSGVIVTSEGALRVDALESETIARAERESISSIIKQPVRYLVSSSFHDPFSKGNIACADVFKIGHENYRAGLLEQMERGGISGEEQRARLPTETFRDRATLYLGGKEIQVLLFWPGPYAWRQRRLCATRPDCVSKRGFLFRRISEYGARLRDLMASGAGCGGGPRR